MKLTEMIDGYADMTPEEQKQALENYEIEDNSQKYKELISKANAEAKKYKDAKKDLEAQLEAKMTEDEKAKAQSDKEMADLKAEYEKAINENKISKKFNYYKSLGYSDELAQETAEAFVGGDFEKVEANGLKAHQDFEKSIRADVARSNPHPKDLGGGGKSITKEEIMAEKNYAKRMRLISEHHELFE